MHFEKLPVNPKAARINDRLEAVANAAVRALDRGRARLGLRGRAADYDDERYEFVGGARDELRRKHYDKSLRLLWKAEAALPWSTFRDLGEAERGLRDMADRGMNDADRAVRERITSKDFRAGLDREYTVAQKKAIVAILAAIGHGEAYAWMVSATLLGEVKSTGARAALTMQVLEEAKHFVVLRELVEAFGVPVPRQSAWEYLLLEGALKARGLDKFYGMNVLVETIALSIFGLLASMPGLDVLQRFHLDESRHTALPVNYFKEFPLPESARRSRLGAARRIAMTLPTLPLVMCLEPELAELGIDAFDFAGSVMRKVGTLSQRAGFLDERSARGQAEFFNAVFNAYCKATRRSHAWKDFMSADTTRGVEVEAVEREIFGCDHPAAADARPS